MEADKILIIKGLATFINNHEIECNGETYIGDHILIATGSKPRRNTIEGAEYCLTSDEFFAIENQPKTVLIIGTGYIGIELSGVLNGLGTKTYLSSHSPHILSKFD